MQREGVGGRRADLTFSFAFGLASGFADSNPFFEILLTKTLHDLLRVVGHETLQRFAQRLRADRDRTVANISEDLHDIHTLGSRAPYNLTKAVRAMLSSHCDRPLFTARGADRYRPDTQPSQRQATPDPPGGRPPVARRNSRSAKPRPQGVRSVERRVVECRRECLSVSGHIHQSGL